jgi:ADP-heptose:LPS heptosyltransferase
MRLILSRTDSIGDVVLTLPVAAALKQELPGCTVIFLGRSYTRPVVELCSHVDLFMEWDPAFGADFLAGLKSDVILHIFPDKAVCRAARQAGIPLRIATAGRFHTLLTCNRLIRIPRKNSALHEAQLNLKMLKALNIRSDYSLPEIAGMYALTPPIPILQKTETTRKLIILHPKSKGSAREWGLENYSRLVDLLPADQWDIVVSGTREEGALMRSFLDRYRDRVTDLTGQLSLSNYIQLISMADALVAASTGPLHIAAALGIRAVGLYAPMRPIFPKRWAPLGKNATWLVLEKECQDCRKTLDCQCIRSISAEEVKTRLE